MASERCPESTDTMRSLILCRERLNRIHTILARHPAGLSVREFARTFSVYAWEVEQAAELGFVQIVTRKPPTGRPARIVENISKSQPAKLPPYRSEIAKEISLRHWRFALESVSIGPRKNTFGFGVLAKVRAYQRVYRGSSAASARASASRLIRNPDVRACRQWFYAQANHELPLDESMPNTANGVWQRFLQLGIWRAKYAPLVLRITFRHE